MIMYAQLTNQDKTKGISSVVLSYDVEADAEKGRMTVDEYLKETMILNPQFEKFIASKRAAVRNGGNGYGLDGF